MKIKIEDYKEEKMDDELPDGKFISRLDNEIKDRLKDMNLLCNLDISRLKFGMLDPNEYDAIKIKISIW